MLSTHEKFMRMALEEAHTLEKEGEALVGSVIVRDGQVVSKGCNTAKRDLDLTAHAEIMALKHAGPAQGHTDLTGCTLYSTGEPCIMCAGAIVSAGISTVVLGGNYSRHHGEFGDYSIEKALMLVHRGDIKVIRGVLTEECEAMRWSYWARAARGEV